PFGQLGSSTPSKHTITHHPWFDVIGDVKINISRDDMASINDALEDLGFVEYGTAQ
ncbi:hypothetical protein VP01_3597g2, partial [Puccinia sorghi]